MDLYQVCSNDTPGPKNGPVGSHVFKDLYRENMKTFLSAATRPRALIFSIKHHRVDLYQVCLNDKPGQNWPHCRGHIGLYKINI